MAKRNPYFQFQQFTVYHDKCAMKVGTDGTILGAWVDVSKAKSILDIGTGSGLIALMAAQKNSVAKVTAIDIEESAIIQTNENIMRSPFSDRITTIKTSLQDYHCENKFDAIVSNPPYFTETLKSPNRERALARHADSLPIENLIKHASLLLADKGKLSVIYPHSFQQELITIGKQYDLNTSRITHIYPTPQSEPKRILIEFSKKETPLKENNIIIELERHVYSPEFKDLMKNFYLEKWLEIKS